MRVTAKTEGLLELRGERVREMHPERGRRKESFRCARVWGRGRPLGKEGGGRKCRHAP